MAILGTGDISITNLFYSIRTNIDIILPNAVVGSRYYKFEYPSIAGSISFIDSRPEIIECTQTGDEIRRFTPQPEVWNGGRSSTWYYNPKDNYSYTLVRLKADHPNNVTGDDNDYWLMKVDMSNFQMELVVHFDSYHPNIRTYLLGIIDNKLYISTNGTSSTSIYQSLDINTGIITNLSDEGAGGRGLGQLGDYFYGYTLDLENLILLLFNYKTNSYNEIYINIIQNINPVWLTGNVNEGGVKTGIPLIKGGLLYLPVCQTNRTLIPNPVPPYNFDILVYDLNDFSFVKRLIGGAIAQEAYQVTEYAQLFLLDNFTISHVDNSIASTSSYSFFAPEVTKVNTLFKNSDNKIFITG